LGQSVANRFVNSGLVFLKKVFPVMEQLNGAFHELLELLDALIAPAFDILLDQLLHFRTQFDGHIHTIAHCDQGGDANARRVSDQLPEMLVQMRDDPKLQSARRSLAIEKHYVLV
jgi:hypothetical protein